MLKEVKNLWLMIFLEVVLFSQFGVLYFFQDLNFPDWRIKVCATVVTAFWIAFLLVLGMYGILIQKKRASEARKIKEWGKVFDEPSCKEVPVKRKKPQYSFADYFKKDDQAEAPATN